MKNHEEVETGYIKSYRCFRTVLNNYLETQTLKT